MIPVEGLQKIIELSKAATPGKYQWVTEPGRHAIIAAVQDNVPVIGVAIVNDKLDDKNGKQKKADAAFIVSACNAAAEMAAEIIRLREELGKIASYDALPESIEYDLVKLAKEALKGGE